MRRLLLALCLLASPAWADSLPLLGVGAGGGGAGSPWLQGVDMRDAILAGTVTDCANCAYEIADAGFGFRQSNGIHPSAGMSATIGWSAGTVGSVIARTRNSALDARIVGFNGNGSTTATDYDVALDSTRKSCDIVMAVGSPSDSVSNAQIVIRDGAGGTTLATVGAPNSVPSGSAMAADGVTYTDANWLITGSTKTVHANFTGTIAEFHLPSTGVSADNLLQHLFLTCN